MINISAAADNTRLITENRDLKIHCNRYHEKYHSLREIHFKNQFRIQELEEVRDSLNESSQRLKINNNKYLDMIRKQNDRVKQMEQSLKIQTMRGSLNQNHGGGGFMHFNSSVVYVSIHGFIPR